MSKALKAGRLAISAEQLGNEHECDVAGRTCGRLAAHAGLDTDALYAALQPHHSERAWAAIVDGWYECAK